MEVKGTNLFMTRGDSESITVTCTKNGTKVSFTSGDIIHFTMKKHINDRNFVLQKIITDFTDGKAIIEILPEDTKDLQFKKYVYDIQWTTTEGRVSTIVRPSEFTIGPEITDA